LVLRQCYSSFYFTLKQRIVSAYAFCKVAPDQNARADYFKYHKVWLKKLKPAHSFLIGSNLNRDEIQSINRAAGGFTEVNAQGVTRPCLHVPGQYLNYDRVEPGDRVNCAKYCNEFINEGVQSVGSLLPIADPETLTVQYFQAVTQLAEVPYWEAFDDGFEYTGEIENHPDYRRIVTTFADHITSTPVAIQLLCYVVVLADIDSNLTFMAMSYPIAKSVGPILFVKFFGILKQDTNFKTFSVDVLDSLRARNGSFYNSGITALEIIIPRLSYAALQFGIRAIVQQVTMAPIPELTDETVQPFINAITTNAANLYGSYAQLLNWRRNNQLFSNIWRVISNPFLNRNVPNGNENED
jgi:hypothetical protein